jgi:hypothetical protein
VVDTALVVAEVNGGKAFVRGIRLSDVVKPGMRGGSASSGPWASKW